MSSVGLPVSQVTLMVGTFSCQNQIMQSTASKAAAAAPMSTFPISSILSADSIARMFDADAIELRRQSSCVKPYMGECDIITCFPLPFLY